jgi:hypothetical protein
LNAAKTVSKALVGYITGVVGEELRVVSIGTSVPTTPMVRIGVHADSATPDEGGVFQVGAYSVSYAGLWAGGVIPATTNYAFRAGVSATLVNVPGTADNIFFRSADATMVVFNRDVPTNVVAASSAYGMFVGGYNASSCALWNAGRIPTSANYGLLMGDTQTALNAPTGGSVLIGIDNATKVTISGTSFTTVLPTLLISPGTGVAGTLQITGGPSGNAAFGMTAASNDLQISNAVTNANILLQTSSGSTPVTRLTVGPTAITAALPVVLGTVASTTSGALYNVANRGMVNHTTGPRLMVGTVFRGATGTTITNSTAETAISTTAAWGTATLPANILQAGTQVRVRLMINITNSSVANTLTVRVKIGGTTVWAFASTSHITAPHAFDVIAYTAAAPSASSAVMAGGYNDPYFAASATLPNNLATNGALAITATMTWALANASSVTGYIAGIDIM